MNTIDFVSAFELLTGNPPFPWQQALHARFLEERPDNIPASCNLPTGLGKTSVIAVWLIALANGANVPRRLVYVVNRRTVVDQTTVEVEKLRNNVTRTPSVEAALQRLCETVRPVPPGKPSPVLAISTLRGQFADNREWSADPARPAVICGTVDMIGSRLLFSGYGCSFKTRPLHAGFLGQDALIIHDEAHLEPAFQELLLSIEREQQRCKDFRPLRVMELTATSRSGQSQPFRLSDEEIEHKIVKQRIEAAKKLHLHPSSDPKKLAEEISDRGLTFKDSGRPVLVFVRKVEDVEKIVTRLKKERVQVQQLTGTLRGYERDQLASRCPIFARFLPPAKENASDSERWVVTPQTGTVYLVCTSAGEVGVNISADHLICDLSTFESMTQRFGRVNRFGTWTDTEIHVIHPKNEDFDEKDPLTPSRQRTLAILQTLPSSSDGSYDASPAALGGLDAEQRIAAFAPPPTILPVSDIVFDSWSLTTVRGTIPGRPPVEPYLHGLVANSLPETYVAWREEVAIVVGDLLKRYPPQELLEDYPLKPHELLRDNSSRVFDRLKKLSANPLTPVWLLADDDTVSVTTLGDLVAAGREAIEHQTVILPPAAGGLSNGLLTSDSASANDVSDEWRDEHGVARRIRIWDNTPTSNRMRLIRTIDTNPEAEEESDSPRLWFWYELPLGGDGEGSRGSQKPVLWQVHTQDVVNHTKAILERLELGDLAQALNIAAACHDLGKRRKLFQTVLGNYEWPSVELAKSGTTGGRLDERYRHEFGSLIDTVSDSTFEQLSPELKDLVLHVIAAHHGRGRPHFPPDEAFDPERSDADAWKVAREVPQRFGRLQRKYGRWGLAYLESLLRAADYAASANPSTFVEGSGQ